jgi:hypothetical protein
MALLLALAQERQTSELRSWQAPQSTMSPALLAYGWWVLLCFFTAGTSGPFTKGSVFPDRLEHKLSLNDKRDTF